MVLAKPFQNQPSALASFAASDLASGILYSVLLGGAANVGTYFLSNQAVNSTSHLATTVGQTTISTNVTAFRKAIDIDFDTTFQVPQTIEGDCIINGTIGANATSGSNASTDAKLVVQALKNGVHLVSGATATTDGDLNGITAGSEDSKETAVLLDFPKTEFAVGDTLRFTCEVWGSRTAGDSNLKLALAHDPSGRNDKLPSNSGKSINDTDTTKLSFFVPVKIDL
jgi:hypothetical protein